MPKVFSKRADFPAQGFTLLEMLVVLVLVSLASTLVFQGFTHTLHLRARFLEQLDKLQHGALQEAWFRNSVAALLAEYPDTPEGQVFQGGKNAFSGTTLAGLDAETGVPVPCAWQLAHEDGMTSLRYRGTAQEEWEIARWQGGEGEFSYLDAEGGWHSEWPPETLGMRPPQLPSAIMLSGQVPVTWLVTVRGLNNSPLDLRDEE